MPLRATALSVRLGKDGIVVISCDLLGLDAATCGRVRRQIAERLGICESAVLITCTHTHGAPATFPLRNWGRVDPAYVEWLQQRLVEAAAAANETMVPVRLGVAGGAAPAVGVNRAFGESGVVDDRLTLVRLDTAEHRPLAMIINYACHPVNLHSAGLITPDFPGELRQALESIVGAEVPVLYLTGACGDVNPANFDHRPDESAARETAGHLAERAMELYGLATPGEVQTLGWADRDVELALQPLPSDEELERIIAEHEEVVGSEAHDPTDWKACSHKTWIDWAREALRARAEGREAATQTIRLYGLRIGPAAILGIPGEWFAQFAVSLRRACPTEHLVIATLTNGCAGYLPSPRAYREQRYEAVHCPRYVALQAFRPDAGQRVYEGALDLVRRLTPTVENQRSREWWDRAKRVVVGGGQAHKRPVKYMQRGGPAFVERAEGARFWDVDGREYLDYLLGYGPIVLGHADPRVAGAVMRQFRRGSVYSVEHPSAVKIAERMCGLIPCAERVAWFVGGSSTTLGAIRCARAATGREKIVRCGYHGWFDWCVPGRSGVPKVNESLILEVSYDDATALERVLAEHRDEVAGVIIEAWQGAGPSEGYFDRVRDLCDEHGAVFILDEIKTGFRVALGGAQEFLGIEPDLATFGKAMCNGLPGSALVGKAEILEPRTDTFMAATFHADALSLAAAEAVIDTMQAEDGIGQFRRLGRRLMEGIEQVFADAGFPLRMQGHSAMPQLAETSASDADRPTSPEHKGRALSEFCAAMQRRGFYVTGHVWFLCLAHTVEDIERTIAAAADAVQEASAAMEAAPR